MEFYKGIPAIKYEGIDSNKELAFKIYDKNRVVAGKKMSEHLKFAMSYWHTMCACGRDMFGDETMNKDFGGNGVVERAKNRVYAAFELMSKLGIEYFCFHDADICEEIGDYVEDCKNLDIVADIISEEMSKTGIKLLWGTSNCFTHPRFFSGAGTSPTADIFAYAAAKIKKALDITVKLGGSGYVFWGGREGYETLWNTDMKREQEHMAKLMRMAVDYGRSIGFKGDFYVEPKPKEPTKHQYDFDASTVIGFLKKYGLDKDFKLNIEANHATLAGHTFRHELRVATDNGAFGSIDANQGDMLLGWDTDQFPTNIYDTTECMYEVLRAGGFTNGGLNFDAKARRASNTAEDVFASYIAGMDSFAFGLLAANEIIEDGRIDAFVKNRYRDYESGIGENIEKGNMSLKDCSDYIANNKNYKMPESGKQETLESIVNVCILRAGRKL